MRVWIKAIRPQFFTATVIPVLLGTTVAWHNTNQFNWLNFLLTIVGICFIHAGLNMCNDYYDYTSKDDIVNKTPTPFSGGSRVIPDGLITPKKVLIASLLSFTIGSLIGIYLNYISKGNTILFLGITGVFLAFFYTANPIHIGYTGWGELTVGLGFGPLVVVGAYFVQAQNLAWEPLLVSVPVGILIALVLYINEFPDYEADKRVNKRTLVVILGKARAIKFYYLLLVTTYLTIILGVVSRGFSPFLLFSLLTIPLAIWVVKVSRENYNKVYELLPANAATIGLHSLVGLLLISGYILDKLFIAK